MSRISIRLGRARGVLRKDIACILIFEQLCLQSVNEFIVFTEGKLQHLDVTIALYYFLKYFQMHLLQVLNVIAKIRDRQVF